MVNHIIHKLSEGNIIKAKSCPFQSVVSLVNLVMLSKL